VSFSCIIYSKIALTSGVDDFINSIAICTSPKCSMDAEFNPIDFIAEFVAWQNA
jgi:hypothetical protein